MTPLLIATAVDAERDAILTGLARAGDVLTGAGTGAGAGAALTGTVLAGPAAREEAGVAVATVGVGPAAAAAGTARLLALAEAAGRPYRTVLSAGIAGGFPGRAPVGAVVLASRAVQADLGAESPDGFLPLDRLGFGSAVVPADPATLAVLRERLPEALVGDVVTVATVTGTAGRAAALAQAHPAALAEAMEGYGVGCAAAGAGVAFAELRTIANLVGPRDRSAWRIGEALAALTAAAEAIRAGLTPARM